MDVSQVIQTIVDTQHFIQSHPIVSGAIASALLASESLPFFKKIKSSGLLELVVNVVKHIISKKGA